jgi:hypothetical protein
MPPTVRPRVGVSAEPDCRKVRTEIERADAEGGQTRLSKTASRVVAV